MYIYGHIYAHCTHRSRINFVHRIFSKSSRCPRSTTRRRKRRLLLLLQWRSSVSNTKMDYTPWVSRGPSDGNLLAPVGMLSTAPTRPVPPMTDGDYVEREHRENRENTPIEEGWRPTATGRLRVMHTRMHACMHTYLRAERSLPAARKTIQE